MDNFDRRFKQTETMVKTTFILTGVLSVAGVVFVGWAVIQLIDILRTAVG